MGIQLDDADRQAIRFLADQKEAGNGFHPYLFGFITSSVDLFLSGHQERRDLEMVYATVKLLAELAKTCSPQELREIADGTREIPGEDVHSGQN